MNFKILILVVVFSLSNLVDAGQGHKKKGKQHKKNPYQVTKVSKKVHMISGAGGNVAVFTGSDGILLVDSQFSESHKKLKKEISKIKKGKIGFLVNTHWHGDHTGANLHFGKKSVIVAHQNVRAKLLDNQRINFLKKTIKKQPKAGLPKVTFSNHVKLHYNDEEVEILHIAEGHTNGDAVVFFHQQKVVHLGDLFFSGKFPFVDLEHGGNVIKYHNNLKTLLKTIPKDYKIIPGHGPLSGYKDFEDFEKVVSKSIDRVKDEKEIGRKLEDISLKSVLEHHPGYEKGFISEEKWVKLIWDSL